jgi:hypothetical protein
MNIEVVTIPVNTVPIVAAKSPGLLSLAYVLARLRFSKSHFRTGKTYANGALSLKNGDLPVDLSAFSYR